MFKIICNSNDITGSMYCAVTELNYSLSKDFLKYNTFTQLPGISYGH